MVTLQEELDWLTYGSYGLLVGHEPLGPEIIEPLAPGHRPFEILLARHNASYDPEERSEWFRRHGHDETTTIPGHYSQATRDRITERQRIIASNADVRLIEQPQFKRRWQTPDLDEETKTASRDYLLDRLEDLFTGPLAAHPTTEDPRRCGATIGLWESLQDLRRWGPAETREGEYGELLAFAREACEQQKCPCDIVEAWTGAQQAGKVRLPQAKRGRPSKKAEAIPAAEPVDTKKQAIDGAERDLLTRSLIVFGEAGATFDEILPRFESPEKLEALIDDLVATGDVVTKGRGKKKLFVLVRR